MVENGNTPTEHFNLFNYLFFRFDSDREITCRHGKQIKCIADLQPSDVSRIREPSTPSSMNTDVSCVQGDQLPEHEQAKRWPCNEKSLLVQFPNDEQLEKTKVKKIVSGKDFEGLNERNETNEYCSERTFNNGTEHKAQISPKSSDQNDELVDSTALAATIQKSTVFTSTQHCEAPIADERPRVQFCKSLHSKAERLQTKNSSTLQGNAIPLVQSKTDCNNKNTERNDTEGFLGGKVRECPDSDVTVRLDNYNLQFAPVQVKVTVLELTGIVLEEGRQHDHRKKRDDIINSPEDIRACVTIPSSTCNIATHIPSLPLRKCDTSELMASWEECKEGPTENDASHLTFTLMRASGNKEMKFNDSPFLMQVISLPVSLIYNGKMSPFGNAHLVLSSLSEIPDEAVLLVKNIYPDKKYSESTCEKERNSSGRLHTSLKKKIINMNNRMNFSRKLEPPSCVCYNGRYPTDGTSCSLRVRIDVKELM